MDGGAAGVSSGNGQGQRGHGREEGKEGEEKRTCGYEYRSLVESRSMTGAQFLDLVVRGDTRSACVYCGPRVKGDGRGAGWGVEALRRCVSVVQGIVVSAAAGEDGGGGSPAARS